MSFDFETVTHGKWILAGEHAVIRQHPALVFPVMSKRLRLGFQQNSQAVSAEFSGDYSNDEQNCFWQLLTHGCNLLDHTTSKITGKFFIYNTIPIGAGMGSSAAICAALSRWFIWQGLLDNKQEYEFACRLENLFHGRSSGLDIAGANTTQGLIFQQGQYAPVEQNWQPHWYLSPGNEKSQTSTAVKKVQTLWQRDPVLAEQIDTEMTNSVHSAKQALAGNEQDGLPLLTKAINQACQCFHQWGLIHSIMQAQIEKLFTAGAIAVKPTGAGTGGYILSLWPQAAVNDDLVLINETV